ncbi:HAMP domain-containing sensor histidine kinase [Sorangium sp. So ce131]|uniref:HAMP domain-containing sensor histidine kinase n=1 Tax=Sorangium sp. So ce131 TaxID=3133282 RepID=UPI003F5FF5AB
MRLLTRLVLSHTVPVLVMLVALGGVLGSLTRVTSSQSLLSDETEELRREAALHHAAWAMGLAMRRGQEECSRGAPWENVAPTLRERIAALKARIGDTALLPPGPMLPSIDGHLRLVQSALDEGTCERLTDPDVQHERVRLDEQLTDAWVVRVSELQARVRVREEDALSASASALSNGLIITIVACAIAAVLAHRIARTVTEPLAAIATQAQLLGRGNFDAAAEVRGPAEVRDLALEIEALRRRLAEMEVLKQGFLASVSHELRTPLTKIREALALLQDGVGGGALSERQTRILHIARVACEREIRMVTTLLDLSRLSAGSPIRLQAGSSIDELIRSAVRDEDDEARERGVVLQVETPGDVPPCSLDVVLFERAVANLVRNATSVSKPGQRVVVRRELVHGRPGGREGPGRQEGAWGREGAGDREGVGRRLGRWVMISVTDQGPGVPAEIRQSLFEEFKTQPVANSPKRVGIGLGLALSRKIARAHGGDLELDEHAAGGSAGGAAASADGAAAPAGEGGAARGGGERERGATFRLWVPLSTERASEEAPAALHPAAALS